MLAAVFVWKPKYLLGSGYTHWPQVKRWNPTEDHATSFDCQPEVKDITPWNSLFALFSCFLGFSVTFTTSQITTHDKPLLCIPCFSEGVCPNGSLRKPPTRWCQPVVHCHSTSLITLCCRVNSECNRTVVLNISELYWYVLDPIWKDFVPETLTLLLFVRFFNILGRERENLWPELSFLYFSHWANF